MTDKLRNYREFELEIRAELAEAKAQIANQVKLIERFSNAEAERDQLRELVRSAAGLFQARVKDDEIDAWLSEAQRRGQNHE